MHGNQTDSLLGITKTADGEVYIQKYAGIKKGKCCLYSFRGKSRMCIVQVELLLEEKNQTISESATSR